MRAHSERSDLGRTERDFLPSPAPLVRSVAIPTAPPASSERSDLGRTERELLPSPIPLVRSVAITTSSVNHLPYAYSSDEWSDDEPNDEHDVQLIQDLPVPNEEPNNESGNDIPTLGNIRVVPELRAVLPRFVSCGLFLSAFTSNCITNGTTCPSLYQFYAFADSYRTQLSSDNYMEFMQARHADSPPSLFPGLHL